MNDTKGTTLELDRHVNRISSPDQEVSIRITKNDDAVLENGERKYHFEDRDKSATFYQKSMSKIEVIYTAHKQRIYLILKIVLGLFYLSYFGYAVAVRFGDEGSWRLTVCTVFGIGLISWKLFLKTEAYKSLSEKISSLFSGQKLRIITRWVLYFIASLSVITYLVIFVLRDRPENLVSFAGIVVYLFLMFITSTNRSKVSWHTVFWGMTIQFAFTVIFLKSDIGLKAMDWTSDRIIEYTAFAGDGSTVVFGPGYREFRFIFQSMPQVLIFVVLIDVCTHLGVTAFMVRNIGGFLSFCLRTKPHESMVAAANIFVGSTVAIMLVRDQVHHISLSQLFCMLVAGMSSMSGSVMMVYRMFGIPIVNLLLANLLSAPAALVSAKINVPEKEEDTDTKKGDGFEISKENKANNVLEAMSRSTKGGGRLISALVLNMLLFVSLGSFVDAAFEWFGDRMNVPDLTFKKVSSYVFWPLPYLMGAAAADCGPLAELIGVRILTSSSVTYLNLGKMFKNRQSFLEYSAIHNDTIFGPGRDVILPAWNTTLIDGFMEPRSEIVGSYAMCGFASLTSIGMALSTIGVIAPKRLGETSKVMIRAFIVSTIASFITACMAGLLFIEE